MMVTPAVYQFSDSRSPFHKAWELLRCANNRFMGRLADPQDPIEFFGSFLRASFTGAKPGKSRDLSQEPRLRVLVKVSPSALSGSHMNLLNHAEMLAENGTDKIFVPAGWSMSVLRAIDGGVYRIEVQAKDGSLREVFYDFNDQEIHPRRRF